MNNACSENNCTYNITYADGSGTYGYYVSDFLHSDMIMRQSGVSPALAKVVFGCSTSQKGRLRTPRLATDGIFGFGHGAESVVSQLSSEGATPPVFSHCLRGDGNGGGVLVLGEMMGPNITYTPLVPSQPYYNVYLESIAVNGEEVSVDPDVFETSKDGGTVVDSGTTMAYIVQEAYDPLIDAITATVSQFAKLVTYQERQCYRVLNSSSDRFPTVNFIFKGGAYMTVEPKQYLSMLVGDVDIWCIGFQKSNAKFTILGDLVLQDKIIIYDLANERIGWTNYDCSSSINVTLVSSKPVNAGQRSVSCSKIVFIVAILMHISVIIFL